MLMLKLVNCKGLMQNYKVVRLDEILTRVLSVVFVKRCELLRLNYRDNKSVMLNSSQV
jgi:hypothetical protein